MATLMATLPGVVLSPFVGVLVDRWNRRLVMMAADGLIALATGGLACLFLLDVERVWMVYAVMFFRAAGSSFHWSAMQASTSLMVPEKHLSRVTGFNQTLRGAVTIVGPPLGALSLQVLPLQGILAIDVITAGLAIAPLFFVSVPDPEKALEEAGELNGASLLRDVREGLHYVQGWPGLFALLVASSVINLLLTPATSLMPLLVTDHFSGAALELGWLESAWGIGVVVGGLVLGAWGGFRRKILTTLMGLAGVGAGFLLVGLVPPPALWLAIAGMLLAGVMNPITNGPIFSIVQAGVDPGMQGRVFALIQSMATAATPLGMIIAGPVADALGVRLWYVVGGVSCVLMSAAGLMWPTIVHLGDSHRRPASVREGDPLAAGGAMGAGHGAE
jgi:DHA3 family macrolide efflux protein-like MFS transporter